MRSAGRAPVCRSRCFPRPSLATEASEAHHRWSRPRAATGVGCGRRGFPARQAACAALGAGCGRPGDVPVNPDTGSSMSLDLTPRDYLEMLTEEYREYQEHWQAVVTVAVGSGTKTRLEARRYRVSMRKADNCRPPPNRPPEITLPPLHP